MQLIRLTEAAALRVKALVGRAEQPVFGLRVGVKPSGCSGFKYVIEYADAPRPGEDVIEDKGVSICIEPKAVMFLLGTEVDYRETTLESGFVFNNPNQTSACGCGESVAITPVEEDAAS